MDIHKGNDRDGGADHFGAFFAPFRLTYLNDFYQEKLERYMLRAKERMKLLRENPDSLGMTREEANNLLAGRSGGAKEDNIRGYRSQQQK